MWGTGFLIRFEAWPKSTQQWLVCAPLGIHLQSINQRVNAVSDNVIIINCIICSKKRTAQCQIRSSLGLSKTVMVHGPTIH